MQIENRTLIKRFDINLTLVVLFLNLIGLYNLYSATHAPEAMVWGKTFSSQIMWLSAGWIVYMFCTFFDYKIFNKLAYVFYGINLVLLALVPFIGRSFYGAQRWLDLGFFRYQPSETMKLALVFVLARVLSQKSSPNGMGIKDLILPLVLTGIPFLLVAKQPDLGTALMLAAMAGTLFLFVGVKKKILVFAIISVVVALPLAWNFGMKQYQKQRVLTFLDPSKDPQGAGYNTIQSITAVGSGQWIGKGFQRGTQSQLEFLPERHTDFIFSVLSEEHGFVGSIVTITLFLSLYIMAIRIASHARDKFGVLVAIGSISYVFWHMTVNIGMVTGLLPIVGVPLPLLSYGGSGTLTTMLGLGILSSVSMRRYLF
ncbi:MAG: rod shape-determining protein RodA [Bdellovibrionaceae bacterium]|nr:rod shape-determining protein RodA [Pseudobdellovibrionaceae bacterium]